MGAAYSELTGLPYPDDCPFGGDTANDCCGCAYSVDYHFDKMTGLCVERSDEICGGIKYVEELRDAVGVKAKQDVLNKYADKEYFCHFLYYALNPLLTFNLSEKTLRNKDGISDETKLLFFDDIFSCCEKLSHMRGIDDATTRQVKEFLYNHCSDEVREIYIKLLSKTLRLGVTAKTVNKIIPGLIPEWEVQQAYPIEKYPLADGKQFWITQKLNGVRATFYSGQFIARSGVPYTGLEHISDELSWAERLGVVLDGELTLKDKGELSDNEAFRVATGILNSDNVNKTRICYTIFDVIPIADFESNLPRTLYSDRRALLDSLVSRELTSAKYASVLPILYCGTEQSAIWELLDRMVAEDNEGLMVNTNVPYKRTRHRGILKVKQFYTMDLPIIRCEEGSGRLTNTLGAFVLEYKGNEVKVGSGFSDEQRKEFWVSRGDLSGMLCEVKYKEISSDKNTGLESLQFPVFVSLRMDKSEVSYG